MIESTTTGQLTGFRFQYALSFSVGCAITICTLLRSLTHYINPNPESSLCCQASAVIQLEVVEGLASQLAAY